MVKLIVVRYIVFLILLSTLFMLYLNLHMHSTKSFTLTQRTQQNNLSHHHPKKPHGKLRSIHPFTPVTLFRSNWRQTPYDTKIALFDLWQAQVEVVCEGQISLYNNNFLHTSFMLLDKSKATSVNLGGEEISSVLMQEEENEYYTYQMAFLHTHCLHRPAYLFSNKNHLNEWLFNLKTYAEPPHSHYTVSQFTIAIVRYEYANLYHTLTDWYNAFLLMEFFKKTPAQTNILIIDSHPHGMLDSVWSHLFNYTRRLSKLPHTTLFTNLAWGILGYNSPLQVSWSAQSLPLFEQFRSFFLSAFNVHDRTSFHCKQLNILFVWRRDYLAHPRNPKGTVSRKVANEEELLKFLRQKLPQESFILRASQIDLFSMASQLELVVWADILIGMHGAGLSHTLFLRNTSALIELQPNYYKGPHFSAIASWRKLVYMLWENNDPLKELPNQSTTIPPSILLALIKNTTKAMCSPSQYNHLFPP